uniref:Uncharacterized protein n=1 Tax=Utricularia reniformis TaxID=192314 RepID=A0A1Y0B0Q9_9LAMI|nr:hypothetical protein AEK19_MT0708 [Utricularia reniformis]ART30954.1 hypothetical protein AEK19_MT0708 [Utricularia reniformis]
MGSRACVFKQGLCNTHMIATTRVKVPRRVSTGSVFGLRKAECPATDLGLIYL